MEKPKEYIITGYGFDPALTHGALLRAQFEIIEDYEDKPQFYLQDYKPIYVWKSKGKKKEGINLKSTPAEILNFAVLISEHLPQNTLLSSIAIDWAPAFGAFRQHKLQGVIQAYFIGLFAGVAEAHGHSVICISPADVRKHVGLKSSSSKDEMQAVIPQIMKLPESDQEFFNDPQNEDLCDSLILAYLSAYRAYSHFKEMYEHQPELPAEA